MPAKGFRVSRNNIITNKLHEAFRLKTGIEIDYDRFRDIIISSNKEIARSVVEGNDGVRLPCGLGILAVSKYRTDKQAIDWVNTNKLGKRVYHLNLHSYRHMFTIKWFKININKLGLHRVYKFKASRELSRAVAKFGKETNGQKYFNWNYCDFYEVTRLERFLMKRNKQK